MNVIKNYLWKKVLSVIHFHPYLTMLLLQLNLKACLVSFPEQANKHKRNHLKRILQFAFTAFPKPAIFVEPTKRTLNDPAFWQHGKGMQFIAFYDFNLITREVLDFVGKILTCVASICQEFFEQKQMIVWGSPKTSTPMCSFILDVFSLQCRHFECFWSPQSSLLYARFSPVLLRPVCVKPVQEY